MSNYNRNNRSGGDGGYRGGGGNYRRRESGPRQMFHAVCDECGKRIPEEEATIYGRYAFCCLACNMRFCGV